MASENYRAPSFAQSAELAEQQREVIVHALADAYSAGAEGSQFGGLARLEALASALAATGKQQVGEVQGDALAQFEAWAVSIGARIDTDEHGNYLSSALNYSKLGWDAALAARQPGALTYCIEADPAGIRTFVTDVITGTLMVGAQGHTPPPAGHWAGPFWQAARAEAARSLNVTLRLRELVAAAKFLRDRVVETRGAKCMDDLDYSIGEADKALLDQCDAAPAVGNG